MDKFTIKRGVDYNHRTYIMAQMIRNAACSRKYGDVTVSIETPESESYLIVSVTMTNGKNLTK